MSDTDETLFIRLQCSVEEQERAIHALRARVETLEARAYKGPMPVNYPDDRVIGY